MNEHEDLQITMEDMQEVRTLIRSTVQTRPERYISIAMSRISLALANLANFLTDVSISLHHESLHEPPVKVIEEDDLPETLILDEDLPLTKFVANL